MRYVLCWICAARPLWTPLRLTALLTLAVAFSFALGSGSAPISAHGLGVGAVSGTTPTPAGTGSTGPAGSAVSPASCPASPAPSPGPPDLDVSPVSFTENTDAHGPHNIFNVQGHADNSLKARGAIQLNHIHDDTVDPLNEAYAYGSCTGCQTFAVALQIDLYSADATNVAPQNYSIAINDRCTDCDTIACALQYAIPEDDPGPVPPDVQRLVQQLQQQLQSIRQDRSVPQASQVEATINGVINQFTDLAQNLYVQRQEAPASNAQQTYPC